MKHITSCLIAASLSLGPQPLPPPLTDVFSTDTSANYTGGNSFNSGGSFNVSGGTLNLTAASNNTYSVVRATSSLEVGETYSIDVLDGAGGNGSSGGADSVFVMLTSGTGQPNGSSTFGFRLRFDTGQPFVRLATYTNVGSTLVDTATPLGVAPGTIWIDRVSQTEFQFYHGPLGSRTLITTGSLLPSEVTGPLRVGVQGYSASGGSELFRFDNLRVGVATWPSITSFTASGTLLNDPGPVTFTWSTQNAASATLNGVDVTGQSPLTLTVNESGDYTLVVLGTDGTTTSQTIRVTVGEAFSIAAVADPQYAASGPRGNREPGEGVNRLTHAVSQWNQRQLDWGVIVGDIIDWDDINYGTFPASSAAVAPQDWSNTDAILAAWDQLEVPKYLVLGNHDYYVPHQDPDGLQKPHSVYRKFGFKDKAYYDFRHKGFRFIVVEGDNSHLNYAEGTPEYIAAKAYFDAFTGPQVNGGSYWWNAGILNPQLLWLMERLDESQLIGEPVVIMCHYPIHTPLGGHSMDNSDHIRSILDGYRNVVMWLNGHDHNGAYARHGWRHHLNLKGMQDDGSNWYQLTFFPDQISVYKAENTTTPERVLDISRPALNVAPPAGFAVADVGGSASLSWDAEPGGTTSVVIEARHVPTAEEWKPVTTLAAPSVGTYVHSPVNPVSEYKYRIRFEAGAERSRYSKVLSAGETAGVSYSEFAEGAVAAVQSPSGDADGDGKPNAFEHFHGTPLDQADADPERELAISRTPAGALQLTFSHDAATLHAWDLSLSTDLGRWTGLARDVDYRIVNQSNWVPGGGSQELTQVTVEMMSETSRTLAEVDDRLFARLVVTPAID